MYLIPINTGVWGFTTLKGLFFLHQIEETEVPEQLRSESFFTAFALYWQRRKDQHSETPDRDTFVATMQFLAAEPDPIAVVMAAANVGGKVYKQFFPTDPEQRQHLRACKPFLRYAVRTHRKSRAGAIVRDTVFSPRTVTGEKTL